MEVKETKRRLLVLARFLEGKVKRHWFYIGSWASIGFRDRECGSTACALGWATQIPEFQRLGLKMKRHMRIRYGKLDGLDAARSFFGIDHGLAYTCFMASSYDHRRQGIKSVIKRLRLVAKNYR